MSQYKNKIVLELEELYSEIGNKWVQKNSLVLHHAKHANLCVGGSIAMAVARKKAYKIPGDLDFFTDKPEDADEFVNNIIQYLNTKKNVYYFIKYNNSTKYCLPGVSQHIKIRVPYWLSICVMILDHPIRSYYSKHGLRVQNYDDVIKSAKECTSIDKKPRVECFNNIIVSLDIDSMLVGQEATGTTVMARNNLLLS